MEANMVVVSSRQVAPQILADGDQDPAELATGTRDAFESTPRTVPLRVPGRRGAHLGIDILFLAYYKYLYHLYHLTI